MNKISLQIFAWVGLYFLIYFVLAEIEAYPRLWSAGFSFSLVITALVPTYMHLRALDRYLFKQDYLRYLAFLIAIILMTAISAHFYFSRVFGTSNHLMQWIIDIAIVLVLATAMRTIGQGLAQKILVQKYQTEKLRTEVQMLRGQLNPHFYFNTLNNLYSLSLEKSDLLPEGILKLSGLMRYVLDSADKEMVPLSDEVSYIQDYLALERLRLEDGESVQFEVDGELEGRRISPMIFMTFVENCIKHGQTTDANSRGISIKLIVTDEAIVFKTENAVRPKRALDLDTKSTQVGLENVRRRLELVYSNMHTLDIEASDDLYRVELRVMA